MNKYQSVDFTNVDICGGFWKDRQNTNRKITVYAVWKQFLETGRFSAFEMNWQEVEIQARQEDMPKIETLLAEFV